MKTFLDAGVLIAAYRGQAEVGRRALEVLDDSARLFVSSDFVQLEVIPKASYYKREDEVAFYEAFFAKAKRIHTCQSLFEEALREATDHGLNAVDAPHIAAAKAEGCQEFFTTEDNTKPLSCERDRDPKPELGSGQFDLACENCPARVAD